jgi:hypothetical protein
MSVLRVELHQLAPFLRSVRGDVFGGHFLSVLALNFSGFEALINNYENSPAVVFSSPVILKFSDGWRGHNVYPNRQHSFADGVWYRRSLTLLAYLDESQLPLLKFTETLSHLGELGFGGRSSLGYGRFRLVSVEEFPLSNEEKGGTKIFTALGPFLPPMDFSGKIYGTPLIHQGHVGGGVANHRKVPLRMVREGAVIFFPESSQVSIFGRGESRLSSHFGGKGVHQGHTLVLPYVTAN